MKRALLTAAISSFALSAHAASVVNMGSQSQIVVVDDGGGQSEISVPAGQSIQFCQNGCIVTLPDGERQALTGAENITLTDPAPGSDNSGN